MEIVFSDFPGKVPPAILGLQDIHIHVPNLDHHLRLLHFNGVRVVSVADGLDTGDEEAKLGIQIRGIFNELQLSDLKKKTLRGQMGQKQRGFIVGEATFGYRSTPVGTVRMDKT